MRRCWGRPLTLPPSVARPRPKRPRTQQAPAAAAPPAAAQPAPAGVPAPTSAAPAPASNEEMYADLQRLKELLDAGILTQAEFDAKKQQILGA